MRQLLRFILVVCAAGFTASHSTFPQRTRFLEWLQNGGANVTGPISLMHTPSGHELRLTDDNLARGTTLATVPLSLCVSRLAALDPARSAFAMGLRAVWQQSPAHDDVAELCLLALFVALERRLGSDSWWAPYLDMLPPAVGTGASFTREELEFTREVVSPALCMQGISLTRVPRHTRAQNMPQLLAEATGVRTALERCREMARMLQLTSTIVPRFSVIGALQDWELVWAFEIVLSRSVRIKSLAAAVMPPLLDMCNHDPNALPLRRSEIARDHMELRAAGAAPAGAPALATYGAKRNEALLATYGFALAGNPSAAWRLQLLGGDTAVDFALTFSDPAPSALLAALRRGKGGVLVLHEWAHATLRILQQARAQLLAIDEAVRQSALPRWRWLLVVLDDEARLLHRVRAALLHERT